MCASKVACAHESDQIEGTEEDDRISAMAGNDNVDGLGGDDIIRGGQNNDGSIGPGFEFEGGDGDDQLFGEAGDDTEIDGDDGDDLIRGGTGNDGAGEDGDREDSLRGEGGRNVVHGDQGNDVFDASTGASEGGDVEKIYGGDGNDDIVAIDGVRDIISCGPGRDTVSFDRDLDSISGCEVRRPFTFSLSCGPGRRVTDGLVTRLAGRLQAADRNPRHAMRRRAALSVSRDRATRSTVSSPCTHSCAMPSPKGPSRWTVGGTTPQPRASETA